VRARSVLWATSETRLRRILVLPVPQASTHLRLVPRNAFLVLLAITPEQVPQLRVQLALGAHTLTSLAQRLVSIV